MTTEFNYIPITANELITFHDRLESTAPGLAGVTNRDKAEAAIDRVATLSYYGELPDVWHVAAAYLEAVARAHLFSDYNKRSAFFTMAMFLLRNGIELTPDASTLVELVVNTATGELDRSSIAATLQKLAVSNV